MNHTLVKARKDCSFYFIRTVYKENNFEELLTAKLSNRQVVDTSLKCGGHDCDDQIPIFYCVQCRIGMCNTHQQVKIVLLEWLVCQHVELEVEMLNASLFVKLINCQHEQQVCQTYERE